MMLRLVGTLVLSAVLGACGDGGGASSAAPASSSASPKASGGSSTSATAAPKTPSKPKEVEMVDTDLSPRGDEWKGLTIKAPKDAKIMDDMGDCRVAATRTIDIILSQKTPKNDVAAMKKYHEDLAAKLKGTITFSNETPTGFDWKRETPNETFPDKPIVREDFFTVVEIDGKKIGCFPSNSSSKEEIQRTREACKTLAKK
jgi:hypothetical protein